MVRQPLHISLVSLILFLMALPADCVGAQDNDENKVYSLEDLIRMEKERKKRTENTEKTEKSGDKSEEDADGSDVVNVPETDIPMVKDIPEPPEIEPLPEVPLGKEEDSPEDDGKLSLQGSDVISPVGKDIHAAKANSPLPQDGSVVSSRVIEVRLEVKEKEGDEASAAEASKSAGGEEQVEPPVTENVQWYEAHFEKMSRRADIVPHRLLRCRLLAAMLDKLKKSPKSRFKVTGITTVFGDRAYLMLRRVEILDPVAVERERKVVDSDGGETKAATGVSDKDVPEEHKADVHIRALLNRDGGVGDPFILPKLPARAREDHKGVVPDLIDAPIENKGSFVVNRVVRIVVDKDERWYLAKFIADNSLREPPMRIHPSALLNRALLFNSQIGRSSYTRNFIITGEITSYQGRRYVLIKKLLRQRDLGRF